MDKTIDLEKGVMVMEHEGEEIRLSADDVPVETGLELMFDAAYRRLSSVWRRKGLVSAIALTKAFEAGRLTVTEKKPPKPAMVVEAFYRVARAEGKNVSLEMAKEKWKALPDEKKKQIQADKRIQGEVAAIRKERQAEKEGSQTFNWNDL